MSATDCDAVDALRIKLDNAGRVLANQGHDDLVAGHVSVRLPDNPNLFLTKARGIGLDEMTPQNIITVNLEGEKVAGSAQRQNEVFIHSEILRARPDVQSVVHTHPIHAIVFSSLGKQLLPIGGDATAFRDGLPVFSETADNIVDQARGKAVARCLGRHSALILRNHGIVTAGRSIEQAIWYAVKLERACRMQLMAEAANGPTFVIAENEVTAKGKWVTAGDLQTSVFDYLVRRSART